LDLSINNDISIVKWARNQKLILDSLSGAVSLLLVIHAPVAATTFSFFHCRNIYDKYFLYIDYKLQCGSGDWLLLTPLVIIILVGFVIGLPLTIFSYLFRNRKKLYSSKIFGRVGFLYSDYRKGAEFYEGEKNSSEYIFFSK
jgi:hypothetical protein